jgi:hypothetical protein
MGLLLWVKSEPTVATGAECESTTYIETAVTGETTGKAC